jgi:hypothetical protein
MDPTQKTVIAVMGVHRLVAGETLQNLHVAM